MRSQTYLCVFISILLSCCSDQYNSPDIFYCDNGDCKVTEDGDYATKEECEQNCAIPCRDFISDSEGNIYKVVTIGNQCWMAENLRADQYRDGLVIPKVTNYSEWSERNSGAWCYYQNNNEYNKPYGKLYNWYVVNNGRGICPYGYHIPTAEDWNTLFQNVANGGALKASGLDHWDAPNEGATNNSGFNALPAGMRSGEDGRFLHLGKAAVWFQRDHSSATNITTWALYSDSPDLVSNPNELKRKGVCIRCVRNME